jgi:hypothetical protein
MPRFFFNHLTKDGKRELDIDGLKLPSLNNALDEAAFAAQGAVAVSEEPVEGMFEIEDEGRVVVARVPYSTPDATDDDTSPAVDPKP